MIPHSVMGKRKQFTVKDKLDAISQLNKGASRATICHDLGLAESTLRGWIKDEANLRKFVSECEETEGLNRKKARLPQHVELDRSLFMWFVHQRDQGIPLSGPILKAQAEKLSKDLGGDDDFTATEGWLSRWKKRHGISQVTVSGESRSADSAAATDFPSQLKVIISEGGYSPEQIYNCDETALFYKLLPQKSLAEKHDSQKSDGFKKIKDRVTLMFCVNETGNHKLKPLCIGRSQKPRCFHHVNMKAQPVVYTATKNAWMTRTVFSDWFYNDFVPDVKKHQNQKGLDGRALLLLDQCPAHPAAETLVSRDRKIVVHYLPKNTTALIQPLDQGIIHTFKRNYRRELLSSLITATTPIPDFLKTVTLKHAFQFVWSAWNAVTPTTIHRCWMKGLGAAFSTADAADDEDDFDGFEGSDIVAAEARFHEFIDTSATNMLQWYTADEREPTSEVLSDTDIVAAASTTDCTTTTPHIEDDTEETVVPPRVSDETAVEYGEGFLSWLETKEVDYIDIVRLGNMVKFAKKIRDERKKQKKIVDFFK